MSEKTVNTITLTRLAKVLRVSYDSIIFMAKRRNLELVECERRLALSSEDASLIVNWKRTTSVRKASFILHVHTSKIDRWISERRLKRIVIWGRNRIFLTSIEKLKENGVFEDYIVYPERKGFARMSKEKLLEISEKRRKTRCEQISNR